jgi:DNA mismatch endonuclease (patch repair protein)
MVDIYTKEKRSQIMANVSGKNTKPERIVQSFLFSKGIVYKKHVKSLAGTPDIVIPECKIIIFVNGCFWHGHKACTLSRFPKTKNKFWSKKITTNIKRDSKTKNKLRRLGWSVLCIWQCELSNSIKRINTLERIYRKILKKTTKV